MLFAQSRIATALLLGLVLRLGIVSSDAGSATWTLNPSSGDWNTAANWTPATVPNGPADTATFDVSTTTAVSLTGGVQVDGIVFDAGASPFTIAASTVSGIFTISGVGVTNNSGTTQNFVTPIGTLGSRGLISFENSATAGVLTTFTNIGAIDGNAEGGVTRFLGTATAGSATFTNNGGRAAGSFGSGTTEFFGGSAGDATFINNGGTVFGAQGGLIYFVGSSNAGNCTITNNGGEVNGALGGTTEITGGSSAGNATLIANGGVNGALGGVILLTDDVTGGTARAEIFGNGRLDVSGHSTFVGVTLGSIEGDGDVFVGAVNLIMGANDLSTTFSGVIKDGGIAGGTGGSLSKIGNGKLTLSGANTFTGGTTINAGTLLVTNRSGSGTGRGPVQINAGKLGGTGKIAGNVTVGDGVAPEAYLTPGITNGIPAILTIQKKVTFRADGTQHFGYKSINLTADYLIVRGVTIGSGAELFFGPIDSGALPIGTVFTVIDNRAATPIAGTFSNIADGGTVTVGLNTFQANYEGGDGNDLTLTVIP